MKLQELLDQLFPSGHRVELDGDVLRGEGQTADGPVALAGTTNHATLGAVELMALTRVLLDIMGKSPERPILLLVDNRGQRMAFKEELLGLSQYIANLVKAQDAARRRGHKLLTLVYGDAIAGGFIACGLCADRIYAVADARTSVMALPAVARVTKLPLEQLERLAKTTPVFAPGVDNSHKMGGLHEIWKDQLDQRLLSALRSHGVEDDRAELGFQRGGRTLARDVARMVENAP